MKQIAIASDHAGFGLKTEIINFLKTLEYEVMDLGAYSDLSVDYPDFGHLMAEWIEKNPENKGIVICGSGNGINITVNKHQKIRSALCWNEEITSLARQHNDANVLALPGRFIQPDQAKRMVDIFLTTAFEGGRHQKRIDKIPIQ